MFEKHIARTMIAASSLLCTPAFSQSSVIVPIQTLDKSLRNKLPKEILQVGEMTSVNSGSFPPYDIVGDAHTNTGASADFTKAIGELLGIKINHETVSGLPALLLGIKSNRYQFAFGPIGDFPDREKDSDFVDWVQEYVVFAVQSGNPQGIRSIEDTSGKRVAVMAGGSAEKVIKQQSQHFVEIGKAPVEVQSFKDQPTAILAVKSKRSDAFFSSQAPLSYFVHQTNGELELAAVGQKNGFSDLIQGAVVAKGSALGEILLEGIQKLYKNGTYATIMKKWGLTNNMLKEPGINLTGKQVK